MNEKKAKLELDLRQAAADGSQKRVRELLKTKVDVNSAGSLSKQTALHRAASKGNTHILPLLINAGADINLLEKDNNNARQLALNENYFDAAEFLNLISLSKQAVVAARKYFTERADSRQEIVDFREQHKNLFLERNAEISNEVEKHLTHMFPNIKHRCMGYTEHLIESVTALEIADKLGTTKGMCGEFSRAAFCFLSAALINQIPPVSIELFDISLESFERNKQGTNHAFLVLSRPISAEVKETSEWENAIICDADPKIAKYNVYCSKDAPEDSLIARLQRYNTRSKMGFPNINFDENKAVIDIWMDLITQGRNLLTKRGIEVPTLSSNKPENTNTALNL